MGIARVTEQRLGANLGPRVPSFIAQRYRVSKRPAPGGHFLMDTLRPPMRLIPLPLDLTLPAGYYKDEKYA